MKISSESKGHLEIILASALFGFLPILVRFGENLGAYNLSFFRVVIAAIGIYVFIKVSKKTLAPLIHERKKMLLFGSLHGFIIMGYFLAIQHLTIASAVLLLYSSSVWIMVFSWLILKEKITAQSLVALVIACTGIILVLSPESFFAHESLIGTLAGLGAGLGMGLVYTLSKTFQKYDKVSLTFWQNLIAIPFLIPFIFIDTPIFTFSDTGIVSLIGILGAAAFILVFTGFGKIKGQVGSILIMLDIVFAVIFALMIFQEIPNILIVIGGILIMSGTYIITRR